MKILACYYSSRSDMIYVTSSEENQMPAMVVRENDEIHEFFVKRIPQGVYQKFTVIDLDND